MSQVGHDCFYCFALMTLPVFYLNAVSRSGRTAGLVGSIVGYNLLLLLIWYQGSVLRHASRQTAPSFFSDNNFELLPMMAFGKNDVVAIMAPDVNQFFQALALSLSLLCYSCAARKDWDSLPYPSTRDINWL